MGEAFETIHFRMVNLVLPFTILFATFIASLPTTDVTSHLSDIDTLDDRAPSDKPIIITPSIETDVSVKRTETSTPAIPQQPATTLATVISSSSATPAKGSGNSRQYAYYILKCIIGPTADKCYKIFGTQCNSSTGEMTGEAPALFTYDFKCMQYMGYCFFQDRVNVPLPGRVTGIGISNSRSPLCWAS